MTKPTPGPESVKPARLAYMPFWVERWLTSPDVRMMSFAERGLYLEMLAWSWIMGPLPADPKRLARLLGADVQEIEGLLPAVLPKWVACDGMLTNAKLEEERVRSAAVVDARSAAGRAGAAGRWQTQCDRIAIANGKRNGKTMPSEDQDQDQDQNHNRGRGRGVASEPALTGMDRPKKARAKPSGEHAALIAWFIETWQAVHPGATYVVTPKDGVAAAALLKAAGVEEIRRRIGEMFRAKWLGPSLTLSKASGAWNDFAPGYEKPPASGFKAPTAKQIEDLRMGLLDPVQRGQALRWAKDFCGMDERAAIACAGLETT